MALCKIALFFEHHEEPEALEVLINLLPYYKKLGYKNLALEEIETKKVDDIKIRYKVLASIDKLSLSHSLNGKLIEKAQNFDFNVKPVDVASFHKLSEDFVEAQKKQGKIIAEAQMLGGEKYLDFLKSEMADKVYIESISQPFVAGRDLHFVNEIDKICQETNQGIIGLFGYRHARIADALVDKGHQVDGFFIQNPVHMTERSRETGQFDFFELFEMFNPDKIESLFFQVVYYLPADRFNKTELMGMVRNITNISTAEYDEAYNSL